ncbi:MAG: transcription elongation factor GreB [Candidatus Polarisedimenticolaceae bacterium]|nr:transcription elongation factor GreB [Candidatus Polarisedimenticolaceae bacterium]
MGRYRPPQPPSSLYITVEGFETLQAELKQIWRHRAEVTKALSAAAAEGDRSENAEYIYRKKELREIDRRIRYLQKRLPDFNIVREQPDDPSRIFFGAWVRLEDNAGNEKVYRIVGPDEIDTPIGYISIDSPMAKALLKKQVDDEVGVDTPLGRRFHLILEVRYSEIKPI